MSAEILRCPSCGSSDISALGGGALKCRHCGSGFADPFLSKAQSGPIHVHVAAPVQPPQVHYVPQPVYVPHPHPPQYPQYQMPAPRVYVQQVPQKRKTHGCTWLVMIAILGCGLLALVPLCSKPIDRDSAQPPMHVPEPMPPNSSTPENAPVDEPEPTDGPSDD